MSCITTVIDDELSQMDQSVTYWVFFALWLLSAIVETLYKLLWDIFMDWGFFTNLQLCKLRHEKIYTRNVRIVNTDFNYSRPFSPTLISLVVYTDLLRAGFCRECYYTLDMVSGWASDPH